MTEILEKWIRQAKRNILRYLERSGPCERRELEGDVINRLNTRHTKNDGIVQVTTSIHVLAFIIAHKRLETENRIEIQRSGLAFPVTDFKSIFAIKRGA